MPYGPPVNPAAAAGAAVPGFFGSLGGALGGPVGIAAAGANLLGGVLGSLFGGGEEKKASKQQRRLTEEQARLQNALMMKQIQDMMNQDVLRQANLPGMEQIAQARTNLAFADPFMGSRPSMDMLGQLLSPFMGAMQGGGMPMLQMGQGGGWDMGNMTARPDMNLLPSFESIQQLIGQAPQVTYDAPGMDFGVLERLLPMLATPGPANLPGMAQAAFGQEAIPGPYSNLPMPGGASFMGFGPYGAPMGRR